MVGVIENCDLVITQKIFARPLPYTHKSCFLGSCSDSINGFYAILLLWIAVMDYRCSPAAAGQPNKPII